MEVAAAPPRRRNSAKDAEQMEVDNGQSATGGDGVLEVTMHESTKGSSKARKENTLMQKGGRKRGQRRVSIAAMGWPVKPVRRAKNDGVRKVKGSRLIKKQRKERKQQIQQVADLLGNMGMQ
ncbi:unnamed protein product [Ostreobium quekettii]|uniref:Uncharacterized protein n=1 Tax=Ostreobium quekettii TaxID=121088 RepID=A0A8S1JEI7_9CHLO|nr:unnamed protein product [Ostreobium quekettii]